MNTALSFEVKPAFHSEAVDQSSVAVRGGAAPSSVNVTTWRSMLTDDRACHTPLHHVSQDSSV
jgi:hypothetical protein